MALDSGDSPISSDITEAEYTALFKNVPCGALSHIPIEELTAAKTVEAMKGLIKRYCGDGERCTLALRHFENFYDCHFCILCSPSDVLFSEDGKCPSCDSGFPSEEDEANDIWHCATCIEEAQEDSGICAYCQRVLVDGECVTDSFLVE